MAAGLFGALAAWLIAGTHLATSLHFALVSHQICAAHGEVEHADSAHAADTTHNHGAAQPGYRAAGEELEHHQCGLLGAPREDLALAPPARHGIAPALLLCVAPIASAAAPAPDRADLLLVAPKQSPPA